MGITDRLKGNMGAKPMHMPKARISNKMAFFIAIAGGLMTAAFAILIPISALESFTGASGLSEIIPATGAPLGSSARTLFVIFAAILTASILLVLLLSLSKKPQEAEESVYSDDNYVNQKARERNRMALSEDDSELAERIYSEDEQNFQNYQQNNTPFIDKGEKTSSKKNIAAAAGGAIAAGSTGLLAVGSSIKTKIKKLPFMGGDDSIKSFDDLPKLRGADKHPDAPARRPLSAHEDLGERILDREDIQKTNVKEEASYDGLESNLSDVEQTEVHGNDGPMNDMEAELDHSDQFQNNAHLQPHDLNQVSAQAAVESEDLTEQVTDSAEIENSINNNKQWMNELPANAPLTKEAVAVEDGGIPTIDNLMDRLDALVERRSQRVKAQKSKFAVPVDTNATANIAKETPIQKETQLDDYAAVIDNVAVKRAEKSMIENKQTARNEDAPKNIERPRASLVSVDSSKDTSNADIVVTKSQKVEMDNALKSALDTLHKMTERSA